MSWLQTLRIAVWGERAETALERKVWCRNGLGKRLTLQLVRKLDFYILTYCCVSFFFNYLGEFHLPPLDTTLVNLQTGPH